MARTILTHKDLETIEKDYGISTNASIAKKWHIGVPRLVKEMEAFYTRKKSLTTHKNKISGTRITEEESIEIIKGYTVENKAISEIAKDLLRSPTAVRNLLVRKNIPIRVSKKTSSKLKILGDTTSKITIGDRVYTQHYAAYAEVTKIIDNYYRLWVEDKTSENFGGFYAHRKRQDLALISRGK